VCGLYRKSNPFMCIQTLQHKTHMCVYRYSGKNDKGNYIDNKDSSGDTALAMACKYDVEDLVRERGENNTSYTYIYVLMSSYFIVCV
jgi:hypothetical protein